MRFQDLQFSDNKQRINLSEHATLVVQYDQENFGGKLDLSSHNKDQSIISSATINRIFREYREKALSSISIAKANKLHALSDALVSVQNSTEKETIISILTTNYEAELLSNAQILLKDRGKSFSFRIDSDNMRYLSGDGQLESKYYQDSVGKYLKAVIEEYAALSQVERERVYFRSILDTTSLAIMGKQMMKLTLRSAKKEGDRLNKKVMYIKPYGIQCDDERLYNYLIGLTSLKPDGSWNISSIRISRIESCHILGYSGGLSKDINHEIEKAIFSLGVPYLSSPQKKVPIRVQFTSRGLELYRKIQHQRPPITKKLSETVYECSCSEFQASAYFIRLGADAMVLSPDSLTSSLRTKFEQAAELYSQLGPQKAENEMKPG